MSTVTAVGSPPVPEVDEGALPVARTRHPWRWLVAVPALVVVAQFAHGLATNPGWDRPAFGQYFTAKSVLSAMRVTLELPLILQLLFWFNIAYLYKRISIGIPFGPAFFAFDVNGVISGFTAAVIGLALHQGAYSTEIIRAGIISVDPGQLEAAKSLGLPWRRRFFTIVAPQAMRGILPNAANEVISLFKGASIVSVMAIAELFYQVQVIYGRWHAERDPRREVRS